MLRLILYLLLLAPVVYGAVWLADHPGQLSLDWFGYRIQTSLGLLLAVFAFSLLAFGGLVLLLRAIVYVPTSIRRHQGSRHHQQGLTALTHAMSSLAIADWSRCEKEIKRAKHYLGHDNPATLLLSAQLAHASGNREKARAQWNAMLERPETRLVGLRGMIEQAVRDGQPQQAISHAREAWKAQPSDRWLSLIMLDLLTRNREWLEAQEVLDKSLRAKALTKDEARRYEAMFHTERARAAIDGKTPDLAADLLGLAIKRDPDFVPAQRELVALLVAQNDSRQAVKMMTRFWATHPQSGDVDHLIALFPDESPSKLQKRLQKLASINPEELESQIAQARMAIHASEWGVARNYLKSALTLQESPRIYHLLAQVEKGEKGDDKQAAEWLKRASYLPKDPSWHCRACGHDSLRWHLHCPSCDAFDSAVWQVPDSGILVPEVVS